MPVAHERIQTTHARTQEAATAITDMYGSVSRYVGNVGDWAGADYPPRANRNYSQETDEACRMSIELVNQLAAAGGQAAASAAAQVCGQVLTRIRAATPAGCFGADQAVADLGRQLHIMPRPDPHAIAREAYRVGGRAASPLTFLTQAAQRTAISLDTAASKYIEHARRQADDRAQQAARQSQQALADALRLQAQAQQQQQQQQRRQPLSETTGYGTSNPQPTSKPMLPQQLAAWCKLPQHGSSGTQMACMHAVKALLAMGDPCTRPGCKYYHYTKLPAEASAMAQRGHA
jgi:hypothetical protein